MKNVFKKTSCIPYSRHQGQGLIRPMKPSGVAWLGDIPEWWEVDKAKRFFRQTNTRGNVTPTLLAATQKYGMYPQDRLEGVVKVKEETDLQLFKTVHIDDFVISLRSFQGGFAHSSYEGVCSPAYQTFHATKVIWPRFYSYLFKSGNFIQMINSLTVGIREGKNINYCDFAECLMINPPLPEQRAIADYLDEKCGAIDAAIAEAKKGIEEYKAWKKSLIFEAVTGKRRVGFFNAESQRRREAKKMKHSGIPWIGAIPERWKLARLKNCAKVFGRIGFRGYTTADIVNESEGALSLSPSNLKDIRMDYAKRTYISWSKYEESPEIKVCKGDIVFVKTGSSYGKACIVDDMPCEATLNPQLVVLKCFLCHNRYLNYYLQTPLIKYQVELIVSGGTIPTMSQEKMECWKIILPPLSEQQAIADYLDKKCSAIDAMIAEKEALIAELEAYKKSLIFEVVTGKWEVK